MDKSSIEKKIRELFIQMELGDRITDTGVILEGIDSILLLTIVCLIEDEYGIELPSQDVFGIRSLEDAAALVMDACGRREPLPREDG